MFPICPAASRRAPSVEEVEAQIREAIVFLDLDGLREDGIPGPQPTQRN